jgi:DNA gyrase subunit A
MRIPEGHEIIALLILGEGEVLTATEKGYGKRTAIEEFPVQGRGGQGVIAIQTSDRNGRMVGAVQARDEDEIMLISSAGTLVRTPVAQISQQGRNTQGVRLIRIGDDDRLVGLDRIIPGTDEDDDGAPAE